MSDLIERLRSKTGMIPSGEAADEIERLTERVEIEHDALLGQRRISDGLIAANTKLSAALEVCYTCRGWNMSDLIERLRDCDAAKNHDEPKQCEHEWEFWGHPTIEPQCKMCGYIRGATARERQNNE